MKILSLFFLFVCLSHAEKGSLFDGKTLKGWDVRKGEEQWWTTRDGMIIGGSMEKKVPHNTFLATDKTYENFELEFDIKLEKGTGFMNSGLQMRSIRLPNNSEMKGYQVDAGIGWWGKIYDESRRSRVIAEPVNPEALSKVTKDWDWNHYRIVAEGPRIRSWINGVAALDFIERAPGIPQNGLIGFQAHGGGAFEVHLKNITLKELAPTPGALHWETKPTTKPSPLTPEEEKATFQIAPGFTAELVASEEQGVIKPITVVWDAAGRMWTATAREYPVDANESKDAAEALFAKGGTDQVLVFDNPYGPGPHTPRVFAEGLVIPLGILPWKDGALVQYGHEIRHYHDSNNDGKADRFDPILTGFGVQDSHLFPHQFERMPGGWISLAQGLFNASKVQRPSGRPFASGSKSITFTHCKLARMRPDGSDFDLLTHGPNNIWGFSQTRDGRVFLQEANDISIPVAEFEPGTHYPTGSQDKLRSYAPNIHPSTNGPQMGGTGLSGLALVEDEGSPFQLGYEGEVFIIVNPITNRLQIMTVTTNEKGQYSYQKQDDFLLSGDKSFRPIAAHFGPDGCLYVVDWYNKIISHNEVPRSHPDRDKKRGRIWRIRHHSQKHSTPPNLTKLPSEEVATYLGGPNARLSRLAWHELSDRRDPSVIPLLSKITTDSQASVSRRCAALWALEGMQALTPKIFHKLASSPHPSLRYQAIRAAGEWSLIPEDFLSVAKASNYKSHRRTRAALANAVRYHTHPSAEMIALVAALGDVPILTGGWDQYDRSFERYLARWAMETHRPATKKMLESEAVKTLSSEQFLLAIQSLEPKIAASQLAKAVPRLGRPLSSGELTLLGSQLNQPEVTAALAGILTDPKQQISLLKSFENIDPSLAADPSLSNLVSKASLELFPKATLVNQQLIIRLASKFRLQKLEAPILRWLTQEPRTQEQTLIVLTAMRELGYANRAFFHSYYKTSNPEVKRAALIALAGLRDPSIVARLAKEWESLPGDLRQLVVHGLTSQKDKSLALAKAAASGQFKGLTSDALGSIVAVLGASHPDVKVILKNSPDLLQPVIQFTGNPADAIDQAITLKGAFTLETWVKLAPGIDNSDSLLGSGKSGPDFNFYGSTLRVYAGASVADLIVATRPMVANLWTHCAITRDETGGMKLYLDGVLDTAKSKPFKNDFANLKIGQSNTPTGSTLQIREYRIWNRERSAEEIRSNFQTEYTEAQPKALVHRFSGDSKSLKLRGQATIQLSDDSPKLVTPLAAKAAREKFEKYHRLANQEGDATKGKTLFVICLACHKVGDTGGIIGPDLSGAGAMSTEALLHNILTPNAQMESGYYRHDIILKDGGKVSGSLVKEGKESLSIQPVGTAIQVIPRSKVAQHKITKSSLMPEGLIDHLSPEQVADLFTYLRTLK
ncbi:MAG: putative membrane-bound dehydrogenase-like protein [Akkermansiaceae bacterium]|jgi:putative membrane-bound dehydrogenase-like protein